MAGLPTGTVTFLFTDIEGSTKLAREHPGTWEMAREQHHSILREAIDCYRGYVFQIVGDAFGVAFHAAGDVIRATTKAWYTECLLFDQEIGAYDHQLPECLIGFASIANSERRFERAAQPLGAADLQAKVRQVPLAIFDQAELQRLNAILHEELGEAKFEELAAQGRLLPTGQAIAFALENDNV